jgi:hypothetical protein
MIYDRQFGLPQSMVNYLNQPLPDISGILSLPVAQSEPISNQEIESLTTTGLTPEQLALLYPQPQMGGGEGGYQDEDTTIGDGSTLGIDSFGDVIDFGKKNIGTIASAFAFGPKITTAIGTIGKGISSFFGSPTLSEFKKAKTFQEFFENQKAQKAATAAKARASAIAQEQANRDAARGAAAAAAAAAAQAAANRDRARGRQTGGDGNNNGSSGTNGPGANSSGVGGGADAATW